MTELHGGGELGAQDFEEEDVWEMMMVPNSNPNKIRKNLSTSSSSSSAWCVTTSSRASPRSDTSSDVQQSSAPLSVPDWSKIMNKKATKKNMWDDDGFLIDGEDDDGYDKMVPPHEYIARRLDTKQIASFSMCEGIGRTLKGRDLTNLRKAILTKTGFLE